MNRRLKELEILESRVARLENTINNRKDELFGGLIGKVNATAKEWKALGAALKKVYSDYEADIVVEAHSVAMLTSYDGEDYTVVIDEDMKGSEKIRVSLYEGESLVNKVTGLKMDQSKIKNAMYSLFKKAGIDNSDLKRPKSSTNPIVNKLASSNVKDVEEMNKLRKKFNKLWADLINYIRFDRPSYYKKKGKSIEDKEQEFLDAYLYKDIEPRHYFQMKYDEDI